MMREVHCKTHPRETSSPTQGKHLPEGEKECVTYKSIWIRIPVDFSMETIKARKTWNEVFQVTKENIVQLRLIFLEKLCLKIAEVRYFYDEEKLMKSMTMNIALKKILKDMLERHNDTNNDKWMVYKNKYTSQGKQCIRSESKGIRNRKVKQWWK